MPVNRTCPLYRADVSYEGFCVTCPYYDRDSTGCIVMQEVHNDRVMAIVRKDLMDAHKSHDREALRRL
jgi:hypothetical protein